MLIATKVHLTQLIAPKRIVGCGLIKSINSREKLWSRTCSATSRVFIMIDFAGFSCGLKFILYTGKRKR